MVWVWESHCGFAVITPHTHTHTHTHMHTFWNVLFEVIEGKKRKVATEAQFLI